MWRIADDQAPQVGGVDAGILALVDHLHPVIGADEREGRLEAARAPAAGHRHLPGAVRNLVARDRDGGQQRPSQGWGTVAQLLNPTYAGVIFIVVIVGVVLGALALAALVAAAVKGGPFLAEFGTTDFQPEIKN